MLSCQCKSYDRIHGTFQKIFYRLHRKHTPCRQYGHLVRQEWNKGRIRKAWQDKHLPVRKQTTRKQSHIWSRYHRECKGTPTLPSEIWRTSRGYGIGCIIHGWNGKSADNHRYFGRCLEHTATVLYANGVWIGSCPGVNGMDRTRIPFISPCWRRVAEYPNVSWQPALLLC